MIQNLSLRPLKKKPRFEFKTSSMNVRLFVPNSKQCCSSLAYGRDSVEESNQKKVVEQDADISLSPVVLLFFAVQKVSNISLCIHPKYFRTDSGYS